MSTPPKTEEIKIVVMHGDQTGEELLAQSLRLLELKQFGLAAELQHFDLSLENRRATQNAVVSEAGQAMRATGLGLKAATITPEQSGDVGSPNAILRKELDAQVILRTGRRIPNVLPVGGAHAPIAVARMAVHDAYGAKEWRETTPDGEEIAYRTSLIQRSTCRAVAEFAFQYAQKNDAIVFGGPKYTVSPVYEGMFKEELDAASHRYPEVAYKPMLIDATLAMLLQSSGEALVIPALNRDGDLLSDLILQMFGSIAGSESLVLAYDGSNKIRAVMAEAPHGTAPALEGKDVANPMAMILAVAALLSYAPGRRAEQASRAIYEAVFEALQDGMATTDLGGDMGTLAFTNEIIRRVGNKLEVWSSLS